MKRMMLIIETEWDSNRSNPEYEIEKVSFMDAVRDLPPILKRTLTDFFSNAEFASVSVQVGIYEN